MRPLPIIGPLQRLTCVGTAIVQQPFLASSLCEDIPVTENSRNTKEGLWSALKSFPRQVQLLELPATTQRTIVQHA